MGIFEPVVLTWDGQEYEIAPDRTMGAIARIEEIITLKEVGEYAMKGDAPIAKLSMAYGAVLRYAGCKVKDEEIYAGMFQGASDTSVLGCINALLAMMIPPSRDKNPKKDQALEQSKGETNS